MGRAGPSFESLGRNLEPLSPGIEACSHNLESVAVGIEPRTCDVEPDRRAWTLAPTTLNLSRWASNLAPTTLNLSRRAWSLAPTTSNLSGRAWTLAPTTLRLSRTRGLLRLRPGTCRTGHRLWRSRLPISAAGQSAYRAGLNATSWGIGVPARAKHRDVWARGLVTKVTARLMSPKRRWLRGTVQIAAASERDARGSPLPSGRVGLPAIGSQGMR
jgi:hypothetical protein